MEPTMAPRVERLLRSLVGVADLHLAWTAPDTLGDVHILRGDRVQHHQLTRNIVSGLKAGFGIRLHSDHVHIHDTRELYTSVTAALTAPAVISGSHNGKGAMPAAAPTAPARVAAAGSGRAPAAGTGPQSAGADKRATEPAPRVQRTRVPELVVTDGVVSVVASAGEIELERIDVERHGPLLRCRVSLKSGALRYSAIAEAPHSATAEGELAGRVTLDALRAGSVTEAVLDGVGILTIGDTSYIVAAVRESSAALPRASAAPLLDSMAWSAAVAALNAVGQLEPRAVHTRPVLSAG